MPISYDNSEPFGPYNEVYGYSSNGLQFIGSAMYLSLPQVGLTAKFGINVNGPGGYNLGLQLHPNNVYQYMVGLSVFTKPIESETNVYFTGLIGLVNARILNSYNGFGGDLINPVSSSNGTEVPGVGFGFGAYIGAGVNFKLTKKSYLDLSAGYLYSNIDFPNGSITTSTTYYLHPNPNVTTTVSKSDMKMAVGIIQVNLGVSFHI